MKQGTTSRRRKIRNVVVSVIIGGVIAWFLLSKIDPQDIPKAIGNIPLHCLVIAFLMYSASVFFKAARFMAILRGGISLGRLFPVISLYTLFVNILPMRAGELSYVYLLKKQAKTPGTRSFASLIVAGVTDVVLILIAMVVVGWYLRDSLAAGASRLLSVSGSRTEMIRQMAEDNLLFLVALVILVVCGAAMLILLKRKGGDRQHRVWQYVSAAKMKVLEVGHELADISLDTRLLAIIAFSILIMTFRFGFQWYLVRSMGISISIWQLVFALLFGVLFSLIPVHGPAGLGTAEAPWVIVLSILGVPKEDAITSGFSLHILIIMYSVILGSYGALSLKVRPGNRTLCSRT